MSAPRAEAADEVRIRRARRRDWPAARALYQEIDELHARMAPEYFRAAPRVETEWFSLLDDPAAAVFLAEGAAPRAARGPEPRPIGIVAMRLYDTPENPTMVPRRRGHVETLVVATAQRRRGVGRGLMTEATAWARAHGASELVLTTWTGNREADAFYARLGYRELSRVLRVEV